MSEVNDVLIVAEAGADGLRPASLEMVTAGRQLASGFGGKLVGLLIGANLDSAARQFAGAGVDRILVADDGRLAHLPVAGVASVLGQVVRDVNPVAVLIPGTTAGIEYGPRAAARLDVGIVADCIDLSVEDGSLIAVRPVLGGRAQAAVKFGESRPFMATIRLGSFEPAGQTGAVATQESVALKLSAEDLRAEVTAVAPKEEAGDVALDQAAVIVAGGRGLKEAQHFALIEELASVLGGAVAATRAVTDAGWRPHHEQIGQTGRTVSPRLYVAIGISGAAQHLVGMQASDYVVAINRDPDAPIFKVASFGIVGDLFEIVPALIAELKAS